MSLSEAKSQVPQFWAALYLVDIEASLAAAPEKGASNAVLASDPGG